MLETIFTRRSIRKFKPDSVPDDLVEKILKAAMAAPSSGNAQPWKFVVIDDRNLLDEIPKIHPYAQMILQAPLAILVCGDIEKEKYPGRWMLDCSASAQNILLASNSLGLGSVWIGFYPEKIRMDSIRKLLNIPEGINPVSLIVIGYPDEIKPPSNRFHKENIIHNKFK